MTKEIAKKLSNDEVHKMILENLGKLHSLDYVLEQLAPDLFKVMHGSQKERDKVKESFKKNANEAIRALETDVHSGLIEAVDERYASSVKVLADQNIRDYSCRTSLEKAVASEVAHAYIRILSCSRKLNNMFTLKSSTSVLNQYTAILSKQADRAHRQFLNAVMVLKQLKAPTIEMNIKANTAFVSQNQQINVDPKTNEA